MSPEPQNQPQANTDVTTPNQTLSNEEYVEGPVLKQKPSLLSRIFIYVGFVSVAVIVATTIVLILIAKGNNQGDAILGLLIIFKLRPLIPLLVVFLGIGLVGAIMHSKYEQRTNPITLILLIIFGFIIFFVAYWGWGVD